MIYVGSLKQDSRDLTHSSITQTFKWCRRCKGEVVLGTVCFSEALGHIGFYETFRAVQIEEVKTDMSQWNIGGRKRESYQFSGI